MKKPPPMPDVDENAPGVERELDHAEGVDPEQYKEYWAERQGFPQQDDADLEVELDQVSEATETDQLLEGGDALTDMGNDIELDTDADGDINTGTDSDAGADPDDPRSSGSSFA